MTGDIVSRRQCMEELDGQSCPLYKVCWIEFENEWEEPEWMLSFWLEDRERD